MRKRTRRRKARPIKLNAGQRRELEEFTSKGTHGVRLVNRAKAILALDTSRGRRAEGATDIARRLGTSRQAVYDARGDFLAAADTASFLRRKRRETPPVEPKVTGDVEARIIAVSCGKPPEGAARWSLRLLADRCVELRILDSVSHTTIGRTLKKTPSSRT